MAATDCIAYSLRAANRATGISRDTLADAIATGALPAARLGLRRYTILRRDLEEWLERRRVAPQDPAAVVRRILAREARTRAMRERHPGA